MWGFVVWLIGFALATFAPVLVPPAEALGEGVGLLVRYENRFNAAIAGTEGPIELEHLEIPLELLEKSIAKRLDPEILQALSFVKNKRRYVRWILHPGDTEWRGNIERWMRAQGLEPNAQKYLIGYQTASRSLIVEDPGSGAQFSLKTSTNHARGPWRDKKQEWSDAVQIREVADYLESRLKRAKLQSLVIMDEPAAFGIKSLDLGMVVRSLEQVRKGEFLYVPGFSVLHDKFGRELAEKNGSAHPAEYWNENYNLPLARAFAELFLLTGAWFDSPHSQNFLVELDAKTMKPTGRIAVRDLGDLFLLEEFVKAQDEKAKRLWEVWNPEARKTGMLEVSVGLLHGNARPSWMGMLQYSSWGQAFFLEFESTIRERTGLSGASWQYHGVEVNKAYFTKVYLAEEFVPYFESHAIRAANRAANRAVNRAKSRMAKGMACEGLF